MGYKIVNNEEKLRKDSIKIYDFIVNNFKFHINQKEIEFDDCDEIEYAALTYNGVLILDNFSFGITPTMFFIIFRDYIDNNTDNIKSKKVNLLRFFIDYLIGKGLIL